MDNTFFYFLIDKIFRNLQICSQLGFYYTDLKPENLIIIFENEEIFIKTIDLESYVTK